MMLKCIAIYYHCISDEDKSKFKSQIAYLAKNFTFVNSEFEISTNGNKKCILLTFDDGYTSVMSNALPILKKYNIPSIIFFPNGLLGKYPNWKINKDKTCTSERIMNKNEIQFIS